MFSALHATLDYLGDTLKQISEAWEGIVVELDRKLAAYAKNLPRGSMAADFLDLLMMGTASPELETFLMQELTEKGNFIFSEPFHQANCNR
jgi:anaphase-promoting complex subunit 4